MSLLNITYKNNKYYLENKEIPSDKVNSALSYLQQLRVRKEKKIRVRENETLNELIGNSKDRDTLSKYKDNYKTSSEYYKGVLRYELWRKNPKGFFNFVSYLDNLDDDTVNAAILIDINNQKDKKKR